MSKVSVRIDSSRPIFIEADADSFGQIFASMSDEDQVNVFRAMVVHMKAHPIQWDYIAIALEKEENRDVRDQLSVIFPDLAAKDAEIALLRQALDRIAEMANWQIGVPSDTEAANEHARIASNMADVARSALGGSNV